MKKINISILGVGLIGGSLALAIKKSGLKTKIIGFDKKEILKKALLLKAVDSITNDLKNAVQNADIIFLALPIKSNISILYKVSKFAKENSIIVDLGSVKNNIIKAAKNVLNKKQIFVSVHPMAGSEKGGIENAKANLFTKSKFIVTTKKNDLINKIIKNIGADVIYLNSKMHDKLVADISHLPQIIATVLINSIQNKKLGFKVASGSLKDMTRIASSPFNIWEDILIENKVEILKSLKNFKMNILNFENLLLKNDFKKIEKKFQDANKKRNELFRI